MITGKVKFFNSTKGFGFITPDDGSKDAFVHISAVERAGMAGLVEGQKISFELDDEKGRQAVRLTTLSEREKSRERTSATNLSAPD